MATVIPVKKKSLFYTWWMSIRPFSLTVSILPILFGAIFAAYLGYPVRLAVLLLTLLGSLLIHVVTNLTNSLYDWMNELDHIDGPQAIPALKDPKLGPRSVQKAIVILTFLIAILSVIFGYITRWSMLVWPLLGYYVGIYYTKPPIAYKHRGLSLPLVFLSMGIGLPVISFQAQTGFINNEILVVSVPIACLVTAILAANETRDRAEDAAAGSITLAVLFGQKFNSIIYYLLLVVPYIVVIAAANTILPLSALLVLASSGVSINLVQRMRRSLLSDLDIKTAQLYTIFCATYIIGIFLA